MDEYVEVLARDFTLFGITIQYWTIIALALFIVCTVSYTHLYPVGLDGVGDILKFLGAEIVITDRQPAIDLLIYLARNANPARKGDSFEARRDVHPRCV